MIDIGLLNQRLESERAKWRAGETRYSKLSIEEMRKLATGGPRFVSAPARRAPLAEPQVAPSFDQTVDWRNRNGRDYVTPVKFQGGCGSCTSFAVIGLVESMALIEHGVTLELSKADLAFCGTHTSDCTGWDPDAALRDIESRGVVTEARLPYFQDFLPTHTSYNGDVPQRVTIPDHDAHAVKVKTSTNIADVAQRKAYLTNNGPLVCGITCYDEFLTLSGDGIFSPTSDAIKVGGHDILVIGYDETEQYWLVKNSWDVSWGDKGFGKIAYGTCDIDIETATEQTYFTQCSGVSIPRRVLDEIVQSVSAVDLTTIPNSTRCDAFYSSDDEARHIIVSTSDGKISEVYFRYAPVSETQLFQVNGVVDLASFYTDDDKNRHVIVIDNTGSVEEIYYGTHGVSQVKIGSVKNAAKVSAFYNVNDRSRHALVATTDGQIIEIAYGSGSSRQSTVGVLDKLVDLCAFYTKDDSYSHVVAATANGNITEIFYSPAKAGGTAVIGNITGPKAIAGFYSGSQYFSRRVQIQAGNNQIVEIRYDASDAPITHPLYNGAPITDIGGFFSADDGMNHCMVLQTTGQIVELFY